MLKTAIIGASGYTGAELARILANHPETRLTAASSRQYDTMPLAEVFPNLQGRLELVCRDHSIDEICDLADFVFCAVPHKTAMDLVPQLLKAGKKVVDLSADYRLRDVSVYESWYQAHSSPELIEEAVYGLPELYRTHLTSARLVANPGCYPTSIILALAPALAAGIIDCTSIIADSKSGVSGAGRSVARSSLFCEVADGFRAYKVGSIHRHTPEIEQELNALADSAVTVSFTPHLLPLSRGILSTVYAGLRKDVSETQILELYQSVYRDEPFVRILGQGQQPATQYVRGSNFCDLGLALDRRSHRLIVTAAIDNIVKGASGQAIQNMNLMCGFEETAGLTTVPLFP